MIRKNDTMMRSVTVRTCLLVHHRICCGGGGPRFCRMLKRTYPKCTRSITTRCPCVRFGVIRANMCVGRHVISHFEVTEGEMLAKINCNRDEVSEKVVYTEDILAVFTHHTKAVLFGVGDLWRQFQKSTFFKILFHTTQPAHVVTLLAVSTVAYLLFTNKVNPVQPSPLWAFVYLLAASTHFGAQMWMTFVSGLSLFFSLPRHTFGNVQRILFPKYFTLNAFLSLITVAIFIRHNGGRMGVTEVQIQAGALSLCFLLELVIRLYLTPPLLVLMEHKNKLEAQVGVGLEVGKHDPGKLVNCPHYLKIHKAFRRFHMSIAIGNICTMACTVLHLYYLAAKICSL